MSTVTSDSVDFLDLRNHLGTVISGVKSFMKIKKRGKVVGAIISPDELEKYLDYKKKQELRQLYNKNKPVFRELGSRYLASRKLSEDSLTPDELVFELENDKNG